MGTANGSLAAWIINKLAVAEVKAVGINTDIVPADATRIIHNIAVVVAGSGAESGVMSMFVVSDTGRVIYDVVVDAAAVV